MSSILFPDVTTQQGRNSSIWRGLGAGIVMALIQLGMPPPAGLLGFAVFAAITFGIYRGQAWAARAGVVASFAPLLWVTSDFFTTSIQCVIPAYFFVNGWRGLRARSEATSVLSAIGWLASALVFVIFTALISNRVQVQTPAPGQALPAAIMAGDWLLLAPATEPPRPGAIILQKPPKPDVPATWHEVKPGETLPPLADMQVARWILWSDTWAFPAPRIAYYTTARWNRFPKKLP